MDGEQLFSAYAEVFPEGEAGLFRGYAFLCLRRGVSDYFPRERWSVTFSLPTQRCFSTLSDFCDDDLLFSAYAEVFLER